MDNHGFEPDQNNGRPPTISERIDSGNNQNKVLLFQDFLVGINSRFKPERKPVYYRRATILLVPLSLVLFIGLIVLLVLYLKSRSYSKYQSLCTTNECLRVSANLKFAINFSVDPCENFYDFCCGKWSKEHLNHGWYSSFSTFTTITEKIIVRSRDALSEVENDREPFAIRKAKWFYQSCMDLDAIDSLALEPLYDNLAKLNLPRVPNFFNQSIDNEFDWTKTEILLKIVLAMDIFIGFTVQPNIFKRNENVIYLGVLYQSCPLPSPFKRKRYFKQRRHHQDFFSLIFQEKLEKSTDENTSGNKDTDNADDDVDEDEEDKEEELKIRIQSNMVKFVIKKFMEDAGMESAEEDLLQEAADVVNNMTNYMNNLTSNFSLPEGDGGEEETRKFSIKDLQNFTDHNMNKSIPNFWMNYINNIFAHANITINPEKDYLFITETEMDYLWNILDYVNSQQSTHLELYMWWAAVYSMIINTSSEIAEYLISQAVIFYGKSERVKPRSLDCCELISDYMGWAVSYAIADKSFTNTTKPKVNKMINDIKQAFVQHVKKLKWMDAYTKKVTLEKSKEMISFIGYPDWLFEDGKLDRKYEGLMINSTTFLQNMINTITFYTTNSLLSLRMENPRDWSSEAIVVNAYNSFLDNAINVPIAILSYPLYDLGLEALNYGSIGSILGHELTHGFDNTGRKHDKYGNYVQWWSNKTIETFENMTQCFINQYDNFTIEGVRGHIKGRVTLGENLADNGGLNQAYTAYKHYQLRNGQEQHLPGFETYSNEQLFFLAYGSLWCETSTIRDLENQIEYDEHCPNAIRVIGTLQNSKEFSKAFHCRKESYMNPERKCRIW